MWEHRILVQVDIHDDHHSVVVIQYVYREVHIELKCGKNFQDSFFVLLNEEERKNLIRKIRFFDFF